MRAILGPAAILALTCSGSRAIADDAIDYRRDVKPILAARCYACHGALKQRSGLRVDTAELMRKGGDNGPAIVAGKSDESSLLDHVTAKNGTRRMPPESEGDPLKEREIAALRAWIDSGALAPADERPETDPKDHWAFKAPVRPPLPALNRDPKVSTVPAGNPIDAFLAAEHARHGLTPQPPIDKRLLLRRVYLDLIGLPPTREEQAAFVADQSPDAFEKVVDRLLTSKQYGERWGRHWMDIWRYSDWWGLGAEVRNSQKHIWHWRDWIIESLNHDKGYDQMLREMLAADELYPNDFDKLRASGYLARHYFKFNRTTWLDEVIEHTSKAFLGLTMNCSKCHDHKFDPITQADYYRLRAIFEPYQVRMDQLPGQTDLEKDGLPRAFDCHLDAPTYLFVRGDEKQPVKEKPLAPGLPALLALDGLMVKPVALPPESHLPGLRPFVLADHLRQAERQIVTAREALEKAKQALTEIERTAKPADVNLPEAGKSSAGTPAKPMTVEQARAAATLAEKTLLAAEAQPGTLRARAEADRARHQQPPAANARELTIQAARAERLAAVAKAEEDLVRAELDVLRADPAKKGEVEKKLTTARESLASACKAAESPGETYTSLRGSLKTLESPVETEAQRSQPFPTTSTGRRTALAQWLTDAKHPLTARVAVNHLWARHFGRPLVPTVFDFGRKGTAPTHPELLDFLAVELMANHWSMKHLHRLMVTSSTYRITSTARSDRLQAVPDPMKPVTTSSDSENLWYWRMNATRMEAQVLRDSLLHLAGELDPKLGGPPVPVTDENSRRRSLYFVHSHNDHQKFLAMFDDASVLECYRRAQSIVPQQALALENSKLTLSAAGKIAARLNQQLAEAADEVFIQAAFELVLSCRPTALEQAECEQALARLIEIGEQQKQADTRQRARVTLVHALLNHNDFLTIR